MAGPVRILALDFGQVRVGLAATDPLGLTVQPLPFLPYSNRSKFLADLKKICAERSTEQIVLGLPRSVDESLGPKAVECQKLAEQIRKELNLPVDLIDETFTSRDAEDILIREMNVSREKRKKLKDSLAAYLLLKSYLE